MTTSHAGLSCLLAASLAGSLLFGGAAAHANTVVFQDLFGNGSVVNSDSINNFWTSSTSNESTVTEAGGKLVLAAGGSTSTVNQQVARVTSASTSNTFNFFTQKLTFSVAVGISSNTSAGWQVGNRFVIESEAKPNYGANDALCVGLQSRATGDAFVLAYKKNNSAMLPDMNDPSVTFLVGSYNSFATVADHHIIGFDLTLDATSYTLIVHFDGGVDSATYTGSHGINLSDWGNGESNGGQAALQMETIRVSDASLAGKNGASTWDSVTVTQVDPAPEPAALGFVAVGGLLLLISRPSRQ